MPTKAIEKIRSEMTKDTTNPYIQVVGGFLLQHLESNPQDAEKILVDNKTIGKSLDEMWKEAKMKQSKNFAMFTPQEGFEIVMKYFGIEAAAPATAPNIPTQSIPRDAAVNQAAQTAPKPVDDFDIKLEDLLNF